MAWFCLQTLSIRSWLIASLLLSACHPSEIRWETTFQPASTYASPRAADLDGDGIKEILLCGGGAAEGEASPHGLLALDGLQGNLLWSLPCRNQMTGSPLVLQTPEGPYPLRDP
ncbi:MAG: VCBS repeat-containing protein [Bacteroidetes bacterium]|nr:MAG: VCBS repeat-containing protein [Bacteroidota bacterium]